MIDREIIDISRENMCITAMIVSTQFMHEVAPMINPALFETEWARTISAWILEYYTNQKAAPGRTISDIFLNKKDTLKDDDTKRMIASYLSNLSREYEKRQVNDVKYTVDKSLDYLELRNAELHKEKIQLAIESGNTALAQKLLASYRPLGRPSMSGVSLFDAKSVAEAISATDEIIMRMPGEYGNGQSDIVVGDFLMYLANAKAGKSFHVAQIAVEAGRQGIPSIIFNLEMTQTQPLRRLIGAMLGEPARPTRAAVPKFIQRADSTFDIIYEDVEFKGLPTDPNELQKRMDVLESNGYVAPVLVTMNGKRTTPSTIRSILDNFMLYENKQFKIIIIDYIDLMKAESDHSEARHNTDDLWRDCRNMPLEYRAALITPCQSNSRDVELDNKPEKNVGEDKRKLNHVTGVVTINQTEEERFAGLCRLSFSHGRDKEVCIDQLVTLECRAMGNVHLDSMWKRFVNMPDNGGYGFS